MNDDAGLNAEPENISPELVRALSRELLTYIQNQNELIALEKEKTEHLRRLETLKRRQVANQEEILRQTMKAVEIVGGLQALAGPVRKMLWYLDQYLNTDAAIKELFQEFEETRDQVRSHMLKTDQLVELTYQALMLILAQNSGASPGAVKNLTNKIGTALLKRRESIENQLQGQYQNLSRYEEQIAEQGAQPEVALLNKAQRTRQEIERLEATLQTF